jgi:hypothetical protein
MRQIGLAIHQYEGAHSQFPVGLTSAISSNPYPYSTWLMRILPFIEQNSLWVNAVEAYELNPFPFGTIEHSGFSTPIIAYSCPDDSRMSEAHQSDKYGPVALTSYVGVIGTNFQNADGVLLVDKPVRTSDIQDGLSNTLLAGERPPSADKEYGWWYCGYGQNGAGSPDMLLGVRELNIGWTGNESCSPGPYDFKSGKIDQQCDVFHFWSLHPAGANFVACDGSVHFITYDGVDIMSALATRSGAETQAFER